VIGAPQYGEWIKAGQKGLFSIVIPAHNEEGNLACSVPELVAALENAAITYEILVVNDHSSDGTEAELVDLSRRFPHVRHVDNPASGGFGFAVRAGLAEFRGDAVCIVMADGSDPAEDVVAFATKLREGYDCVFGSRFMRGGGVEGYPMHRLILNRMANTFIRALFRLGYNDVTNAFKCYRREVIAGVQPILAHHFNLTVELPLKAIIRGYSYAVVPNRWINKKSADWVQNSIPPTFFKPR